jgi:hypothetical protein
VTVSGSSATVAVAAATTPPPVTISVAPINGFTGVVTFSATLINDTNENSPTYIPTIVLSPTSVTVSSSAAVTTTLSIPGFVQASLNVPNLPGKTAPGRTPWYAAGSGVAFASLLLLVLPRRRRLGGLLLVVLSVTLAVGAIGCGSSQPGPPSGTTTTTGSDAYSGSYTVNVTAQYSGAGGQITQHAATVTYNVQ